MAESTLESFRFGADRHATRVTPRMTGPGVASTKNISAPTSPSSAGSDEAHGSRRSPLIRANTQTATIPSTGIVYSSPAALTGSRAPTISTSTTAMGQFHRPADGVSEGPQKAREEQQADHRLEYEGDDTEARCDEHWVHEVAKRTVGEDESGSELEVMGGGKRDPYFPRGIQPAASRPERPRGHEQQDRSDRPSGDQDAGEWSSARAGPEPRSVPGVRGGWLDLVSVQGRSDDSWRRGGGEVAIHNCPWLAAVARRGGVLCREGCWVVARRPRFSRRWGKLGVGGHRAPCRGRSSRGTCRATTAGSR